MNCTVIPPMTVDRFLKSAEGQAKYDAEIARLNENRVRFALWKKEEARRAAIKNKKRNTML